MALDISVTESVTKVTVTDNATKVVVSPQVTKVGVATTAISSSSASGISVTPTGNIESTTVQDALAEIGANPNFTTALKNKLDGISDNANSTNVTAGDNISITEGEISADVLGAISAGDGIAISNAGVISVSDIAIATVQTADSETAHLALTTQQGDVVIRTDVNKSYIHNGGTAGTIADFTELATNTNGVLSINNATGAVTFGKSDLSDYSANEFIDWTASQTENIHSNNYSNTTYTAGDNISISDQNVISSTASGGGATYTAGTGIGIDSDNKISWNSTTIQFDKIKMNLPDSQTYSGVYFEAYDDSLHLVETNGVNLFYDDQSDPSANRVHIAAFTDRNVAFNADFQASRILVDGNLILSKLPHDHQWYYSSRSLLLEDNAIIDTKADDSTNMDMTNENHKRRIANAQYVHDTVNNALEDINPVPTPTAQSHNNRVLAYTTESGIHWRTNRVGAVIASDHESLNLTANQVQLFNYQWETGQIESGVKITGGTGVTIGYDSSVASGSLTISANPDGLPDQNAGLNGYVLKTNGSTAEWSQIGEVVLPPQGNSTGKFLTTNGTVASWADVDAFPDQGGNGGKFLKTDGISTVSWADVDALPTQNSSTAGKYLTTDGSSASWTTAPSLLPDQTDNQNKYLVTDGSNASWQTINTAGQTGDISFSGSSISSSTDTVTISDKLSVDSDLNASKLVLTGSEQPRVVSNASYEITAPDGVTQNGMPLPTYQFYFYVNDGQTNTTSLASFSDIDISKNADKSNTIEFTGGNGTSYDVSQFYVVPNFTCTDTSSNIDDLLTNIIVRKQDKGFVIKVVDKNGSADGVKRGWVFIQVYDYL